jgi:hypothetical protein
MNRVYTTYYNERKPERRRELDLCLAINSTLFDRLCVMSENVQGPGALNAEWRVVNQRQTYAGVLAWIGEAAAPDDLSVITNCDIVIPPDALRLIEQHIGEREMYCLSRYEAGHGGKLDLYDAEYSQDVWAFRGKSAIRAAASARSTFTAAGSGRRRIPPRTDCRRRTCSFHRRGWANRWRRSCTPISRRSRIDEGQKGCKRLNENV